MSADPHHRTPGALAALTLAAIGVVYGDIGTSPLYALKEVFAQGRVPLTPDNILGILSLVFWTLTVIVSLKYVVLILRADNHGCCCWASSAPPSSSATASSRRPSACSRRWRGWKWPRPRCTAGWCR